MAKIVAAWLAPDTALRVRGLVLTRISRGVTIVQRWPRPRGTSQSPKSRWTATQFGLAGQMAANAEPMSYITAVLMTRGTSWVPRDLLTKAAMGSAYEVVLLDGTIAPITPHTAPEDL